MWIDNQFTEGNLLDALANQFSMAGWEVVDRIDRLAFPKEFTEPKVYSVTLTSDTQESAITIPKSAVNAYHLYTDGSPGATVSRQEETDHSVTLWFHGADNGASIGSPVTITCWTSALAGKPDYLLTVCYANHLILRNASGNLFGIARVGKLQKKIRHLEGYPDSLPFFIPPTGYRTWTWESDLEPQDYSMFDTLQTEIKSKYMEAHTLYLYQMEDFSAEKPRVYTHIIGSESDTEDEVKRAALDMEVYTTAWVTDEHGDIVHRITQEYADHNLQGPIVEANHRRPTLEQWVLRGDIDYKMTNWWNDSIIKVLGCIDADTAFLVLNSDTAPMKGQDNAVPSIPIYMGQFDLVGDGLNQTETFTRHFKVDLAPGGATEISTIVSSLPVQSATVKIWVSGDMDLTTEFVYVGIDGAKQIGVRSGVQESPVEEKAQAYYAGEFALQDVAGKTILNIYTQSDPSVNAFSPIAARVWLEVTVTSSVKQGPYECCLFAGYAPDKGSFDFDNPSRTRFRETIFPIFKKKSGSSVSGYPAFPSNGVDTVQVKRTKFGAYYQEYFVSWNTPSNLIPPERESAESGDKHPRAWNQFNSDAYRYKFNASSYDDRVHVSKAYLVHPEDGVHGTLRNVILCNPLSILNGDELEIEEVLCSNDKWRYYFCLIEGASPLTKRPGTPYRPAGVGVKKSKLQVTQKREV
ncbi:hypothetical protein G3578_09160 [Brevibacillus sp. SYP-B805]|uniref:hypothetical protein n=1 Tax=Brevibacillus sp. SYP-B805 TaxID=1578199 RepID=UPI0013EDCC94|nr:hypothetical protein [Brevibacillus sp. SYP-B805]NGQ95322.1 hypothetical protein [Brevibacillus sp. SYP-B805]